METKISHPHFVMCEIWPWECQHIELPPQQKIAEFSESDAKAYCQQVIQAKWEGKVVVVAGGGGNSAELAILHRIYPSPQRHYCDDNTMYYETDIWNIVAVIEFPEPFVRTRVLTLHLGSWKIALYLESGKPIYGDELKERLAQKKGGAQ
jgi:hypothetical protein